MDKSTREADLVSMDAYFNELSCEPLSGSRDEAVVKAGKFAELLACVKHNGFEIVRCHDEGISKVELAPGYSLADFVNSHLRDTKALLILSMVRPPYFRGDSKEEENYIANEYFIEIPVNGQCESKPVYGLAAAYLNRSIGLNLCSNAYWENQKVYKLIEQAGGKVKINSVYAFSVPDDFNGVDYLSWQLKYAERVFADCGVEPAKKVCNLSLEHHGNDFLEDFARKKLFRLPYISKVVTSLRYHPNCKTFVSKLHYDTKRLDVVLHWTDNGYGMLIQTTARTDFELRQIAQSLEEMFGK